MSSLTSDAGKAQLTPPITIPTNLPFPVWKTQPGDLANPKVRTLSDETIVANVCSEFTNYEAPVAPISAQHKLAIIQDNQGQPIIFSIGSDDRLYCARHVQGASNGWQAVDITPNNTAYHVTAFDATQDITTSKVNLAVAASTSIGGATDVFTILGLNVSATNIDWSNLPWILRPSNLGPRTISTMQLSEVAQIRDGVYPFVLAGTATTDNDKLLASNYVVSLDPDNNKPWSQDPLSKVATKVVQLAPGHIQAPFGFGVFTLFQDASYVSSGDEAREGKNAGNSCAFNSFPTVDENGTVIDPGLLVVILLRNIGGTAKGIATLINNRGDSDLVVAGSKGLGYYPAAKLSQDPVAVIMPDIDFQQVIAAQWGTKISLLATSSSGQVYHIEGSRVSPNADPTFNYTGLPIREGVAMMAVQKNVKLGGGGATEFVCVEADGDVIHVWKDPVSTMWAEQKLLISSTDKQTRTPAFVSQIQLSDSKGSNVGENYNITLTSSEACYVTINDGTYQLNPVSAITVPTDSSGQLRIIYPADVTLGAPQFSCGLSEPTRPGSSAKFDICPTQRIVGQLAKIRSGSDIKNATSTTGSQVFPDGATDSDGNPIQEGTFDALAATLSSLPNVLASIGADARTLGDDVVGQAKDLWVSLTDNGDGMKIDRSGDRSILDKVKGFFEDVGDLIVSTAKKLVKIATFVVSVVADVVLFVLKVEGRIIKFAVQTVAALVRSFAIVLRDTLGIDLVKYLDWLGFILDWDNILKTQKVLANFAETALDRIGYAMTANGPFFNALVAGLRHLLQDAIPDMRVSDSDGDKATDDTVSDSGVFSTLKKVFGYLFDIIFNNPIAKGILSVVTRVIGVFLDGISGLIEIPGVDRLINVFAKMVPAFMEKEAANIGEFVKDIFVKLQSVSNGDLGLGDFFKQVLGDGLWTLFDAIAILITSAVEIFGELMAALFEFLSGPWKIPVVSGLWNFLTDTDLSIVNIVTIPLAFILNIIAKVKYGKLPFDSGVWGDPTSILPTRESLIMDPTIFQKATVAETEEPVSLAATEQAIPHAVPSHRFGSANIAPEVQATELHASAPPRRGTFLAESAEDEPVDPEEFEKLRHYRISDAACGMTANFIGVLGTVLEITMLKLIPEEDIITLKFPSFSLPSGGGAIVPAATSVLTTVPSLNTVNLNIGSVTNTLTQAGLGIKIALDVLLLATHVTSTVYLSQCPVHEPRKTQWLGMKGGLGIGLVLTSVVSTVVSIHAPPHSEQRRLGLFVAGVTRALGNIFHTSVTGCWEYDWSAKEHWDTFRFGADFCELFGSFASGVAGGVDYFGEEAAIEVTIGALVVDAATAISSFGTSGALIAAYRDDKGIPETGRLETE